MKKTIDVDTRYLTSFSEKVMYLWNDEYQCYVRSVPGVGYFARFPGKAEYQISGKSDIVVQAVLGGQEVTKTVYES